MWYMLVGGKHITSMQYNISPLEVPISLNPLKQSMDRSAALGAVEVGVSQKWMTWKITTVRRFTAVNLLTERVSAVICSHDEDLSFHLPHDLCGMTAL